MLQNTTLTQSNTNMELEAAIGKKTVAAKSKRPVHNALLDKPTTSKGKAVLKKHPVSTNTSRSTGTKDFLNPKLKQASKGSKFFHLV